MSDSNAPGKYDRALRNWNPQSKVAVWSYNGYPGFLCGVIEFYKPKGFVNICGYQGMLFKPIKILWGDEGRQFIMDDLDLREEYMRHKEEDAREWRLRANTLLGIDDAT